MCKGHTFQGSYTSLTLLLGWNIRSNCSILIVSIHSLQNFNILYTNLHTRAWTMMIKLIFIEVNWSLIFLFSPNHNFNCCFLRIRGLLLCALCFLELTFPIINLGPKELLEAQSNLINPLSPLKLLTNVLNLHPL